MVTLAVDGGMGDEPSPDGLDRVVGAVMEDLRSRGLSEHMVCETRRGLFARRTRRKRPQWVIMRDAGPLLWPESLSFAEIRAFERHWRRVAGRPENGVCVFSQETAARFKERFGKGETAVLPAYTGPGAQPFTWEERETATGGREYFCWTGHTSHQWINVLKAFSVFKQRQRSQMRLVLLLWNPPDAGFGRTLGSYKYREDVQVVRGPGDHLWAAAYAGLYTPGQDSLGWVSRWAMRVGLPLLCTERSVAREWAESATCWIKSDEPDHIAAAMLTVYKDEGFRSQLRKAGPALASGWPDFGAEYAEVLGRVPGQ